MTTAYYAAKRRTEYERRGCRCEHCSKFAEYIDVEFHHIAPTGVEGMGRGTARRVQDLLRHPHKYMMVHHDCHTLLHRVIGGYDD